MTLVPTSCGTGETLTPNVQLALWPRASVAVHVTVVVPSANVPPDAGEQAVLRGASPPCPTGVS
jgi:hypothetical protein